MKPASWLIACGFVLFSTLLLTAGAPDRADHQVPLCGGEPCDAVARGFRAFFEFVKSAEGQRIAAAAF